MKQKSYIHLTIQLSQKYRVYLTCIIVQSVSFEGVYVCASFLTVAMSVFLHRCYKALISWKWLNICLPMGKKLHRLFVLLGLSALLYLAKCLYLNLCFFSFLPFQFSLPFSLGRVSERLGGGCPPVLNHNTYSKGFCLAFWFLWLLKNISMQNCNLCSLKRLVERMAIFPHICSFLEKLPASLPWKSPEGSCIKHLLN